MSLGRHFNVNHGEKVRVGHLFNQNPLQIKYFLYIISIEYKMKIF